MRIIFVRSSPLSWDIRTPKLINALSKCGFECVLINWEREGMINVHAKREYLILPLKIRAPYGLGVVPFYIVWWLFVFVQLVKTKWDIVYAINFDSAVPAIILGKLMRKPVIYEILEVKEDQIKLPWWIRTFILCLDKLFLYLANAVVVVDELQILELGGIPNKNIHVIYDSPPHYFIKKENTKCATSKNDKEFVLFYAGVLMKNRALNLDKLFEAVKEIENVKVVIAGYGDLVPQIRQWCDQISDKICFVGKISYEEVIKRGMNADAFFILRSSTRKTNKYTCGSKLLNAMICGKPIIVNKGTSTAIKVAKAKCGIVVDANNIEEIKNAIIKLKENKELCRELGMNGRKAYEQKYSWRLMEQRLLKLVSTLPRLRGEKGKDERKCMYLL